MFVLPAVALAAVMPRVVLISLMLIQITCRFILQYLSKVRYNGLKKKKFIRKLHRIEVLRS